MGIKTLQDVQEQLKNNAENAINALKTATELMDSDIARLKEMEAEPYITVNLSPGKLSEMSQHLTGYGLPQYAADKLFAALIVAINRFALEESRRQILELTNV